MPELSVEIGERNYLVACEEGQELHLRTAAGALAAEAAKVLEAGGDTRIPETRVLLMAGLMLADRVAAAAEAERAADERASALEAKVGAIEAGDPSDDAERDLQRIAEELEALASALEAEAGA